MEIRFATARDIPGLIDLLDQVGDVHHQIRPDLFRSGARKYDEKALEALLQDPSRPILAAVEGDTLLGYAFCVLQNVQNDPVLMDRRTLYLDDLCVDENQKGKGIAQALYRSVCDLARELRCQAVTLNVWSGNGRAQTFYEKCGLIPQKVGMEMIL